MKIFNIKDFKDGWVIGNFEPALFRTKDIEIAVHDYPKHTRYDNIDRHYHKVATEYNIILEGKISLDVPEMFRDFSRAHILSKGDGWIYKPLERSYVIFLENTKLLIIKTPSVPGDKYYD